MTIMHRAILLPRAEKQLRKIKDKALLEKAYSSIREAATQPYRDSKVRDLKGIYSHGFYYSKTAYRIAYIIDEENQAIKIIGIGSHEGFWEEIKKYLK